MIFRVLEVIIYPKQDILLAVIFKRFFFQIFRCDLDVKSTKQYSENYITNY